MTVPLVPITEANEQLLVHITPQQIINALFGIGMPTTTVFGANDIVAIVHNGTLTTTKVNDLPGGGGGGSVDLTSPGPIGSNTPSTGAFTTLSASGTVSGTGIAALFSSPLAIGNVAQNTGAFTTLIATSLDSTPIGGSTPEAGAFTNLSSSGTITGTGFSTYLASPPAIGGSTPAAGAFTNLSSSGTITGTGFSTYLASPPAIGGTAPAAGSFTTLTAVTSATFSPSGTVTIDPATIGSMDNMIIGGTTAVAGHFTTLSASYTVSGSGFSTYLGSPPAIGGGTPAAGTFTDLNITTSVTLSPSGAVTIDPTTLGAMDHVTIGGVTAAGGSFTTLSASAAVSGTGFVARFATPGPIGNTSASSGAFTTLSATSISAGSLDSTPIGSVTPSTGVFTALSASTSFNLTGTLTAFPINTGLVITGGTLTPNYQAGSLTTFHSGLTLAAGTLTPDWNGGSVSAIGSNLTLAAGTINIATSPALTNLSIVTSATLSPTGAVTINPGSLSAMDHVTIGGTTAAAGSFTTLSNTTAAGSTINAASIGAGTAGTGAFTTLSASSTVSGTGFSTYLASPPAIGGTAAAAGTFTSMNTGPMAGFRNAVMNGGFDIWQRGTSVTVTGGAGGGWTADRWYSTPTGTDTCNVSQQALSPGQCGPNLSSYMNITIPSGGNGTTNTLIHSIEDVRTYAGMKVTISYWAWIAVGTIWTPNITLVQDFGTGGSPSTSVSVSIPVTTLTNTPTFYSYTATLASISGKTLGSNGDSRLKINFSMPHALVSSSATVALTGIQLEPGPVATPFEYRPQKVELALCQRYYCNVLVGAGSAYPSGGVGAGCYASATYPVTMRVAPTTSTLSVFYNNNASSMIYSSVYAHSGLLQVTQGSSAGNYAGFLLIAASADI